MKRVVVLVGLMLCAAVSYGQVPRVLSYQGILTDSEGRLLPDGEYTLTVRLYARADASDPVYVEEHRAVAVRGVVNLLIGSIEPLPARLAFDRAYYVGVSINGGEELRPRTMLTAVPYALRSEHSTVADVARSLAPEALKGVSVQTTPSGPAGGDLTGTYPNPTIGASKITSVKIASQAVITDKIAQGAVTTAKLADNAVTTAKLSNDAVTSSKIADGTIVNADISPSAAIAVSKLAPGSNGDVLTTSGGVPTWTSVSSVFTETDPQVGTLSNGQVAFWYGSALTGSNNLFWDSANNRLGIGTNAPTSALHVVGAATISSNTSIGGNLSVTGTATIGGGLTVSSGGAAITGNTSTSGNLSAGGNLSVSGTTVSLPNIPSSSTATQVVVWSGGNLERRDVAGLSWSLTGNSGTTPWNGSTGNFLGTTDANKLVIATTNTATPQPIELWVGNQPTLILNAPGGAAPAWSIQRGGVSVVGNTRGLHAVDLQSSRSAATQVASGDYSVIAGGENNTASGVGSVVGGGQENTASGTASFVGGGGENTASGLWSFVGGGYLNTASGVYSFVGGGVFNTASVLYSSVGGGVHNTASGQYSFVGGGDHNTASGSGSFVGSGQQNTASGLWSFVGGGWNNTASGLYSAIPGGYNLSVGARSFGFSGQTSATQTDLSAYSNIAAFVDVDMWLYNVRGQASQLRLYGPSGAGTNYTAFQAQAQASDITYTLPAAAGSPGQVLSIQSVSGSNVTLQWGDRGVATFIRKTTDETVTNSTTYQDDDQLIYTASANQVFEFDAHMFISGGAGGIKIRVNIPTGATMKLLAEVRGGNAFSYATLTSSTSEVLRASVAGTGNYARIRGIITMGSSGGNVVVQWAQNTANATGTTVESGSYLKITPVQ